MKVYIAGPFFNKDERERMDKLKQHLLEYSPQTEFFFPMDHFIENGENLSNYEWAKAVFKMDTDELANSNMIIAVYDKHYSDSGTAWEIGFAYAKHIPIILLCTDLHSDNSIMPMISGGYVYNFDDYISGKRGLINFIELNTLK